jgi:protein-disulfide isomerase
LGKASRIFRWLSWSEVGFFYFAGGFITLLFSGNINEAISIIAWLNIMALPYVIFSIYYQGAIAKEWCLFCLSVQVLLILGGINVFKFHLFTSVFALSYLTIFKSAILYFLPVTLWYSLKPIVLKLQASKQIKRELIRIKFSTEIFQTLLKNQKLITSSTDGLGIDIGDPLAKNTIIKVCNPYCGPCAKMHPEIEKLLEENNNIKAKIIFTVRSDETDNRIKPVKHLLAIAKKGNEQLTKQALDDWYLAEKKDYEVFAKKYPMNGELSEQLDKIKAMEKWCNETDIQFTPTIFINGYQLPDTYNIESLNYLLEE